MAKLSREGIWRLRCQSCGTTFSVELTPDDDITDFVRAHVCPGCSRRPDGGSPDDAGPAAWHQVVDFKEPKTAPGAQETQRGAEPDHSSNAPEPLKLQLSTKSRTNN